MAESRGSRRVRAVQPEGAGDTPSGSSAYDLLRRDLVAGVFAAGAPLRMEALKDRYGLSFSPLREALSRLQSERLVVATALRGFRVADLSLDLMRDLIGTRILIETEALRRSIAGGGDDWESAVVGAFHSLSRCSARLQAAEGPASEAASEDLERRHREFHFALIAACGSPSLQAFSSQLYIESERYRRPFIGGSKTSRTARRNIEAEHRALMTASIERRPDDAVELLAAHYRRTGDMIEQCVSIYGAFARV